MSCSLLIGGFAWAADYEAVSRRLSRAESEVEKVRVLSALSKDTTIDSELRSSLTKFLESDPDERSLDPLQRMIELRAVTQSALQAAAPEGASQKARQIKQSPLYRDPGDKEQSNWFAKGFERLGEIINAWMESLFKRDRPSELDLGGGMQPLYWFRFVLWGVFAAVVLAFLYFAFRHFSWKRGLERKAKAVLGEDEPELSRDEYLAEADRLAAEGKHREAVRYLYLACLLAFDESGVARFVRGQTNWEHLRRIEASEKLPANLDFHPATNRFDVVWYGMRVQGSEDVEAMRTWYLQFQELLRSKAA